MSKGLMDTARWAAASAAFTGTNGERLTYSELAALARRIRDDLVERLDRGACLAIIMTPSAASVAALLAAERMGHPAVLLPAALRDDEIDAALRESSATLLLAPPEWMAGRRRSVALAGDLRAVSLDPPTGRMSDWLQRELGGEAFVCQLTSGSMGPSQLAVRTRGGAASEIAAVVDCLELRPTDRVLCASSLAHSYALMGGLLASLHVGAEVAAAGGIGEACDLVARFHPTIIFGLGPLYGEMLERGVPADSLTACRLALSAGAPLPGGLFEAFSGRYGLPIRQDYGTTETGTISLDVDGDARPASVGTPLPHMEVRLRHLQEAGSEWYDEGEIQVRSPATSAGYVHGDRLVPCVDCDGWYRTRDAGHLGGEGRLRLGRRIRPAVAIGGVEVRPDAVEDLIRAMPGLQEVVVVPAVSAGGKPVLKAVVVAPGLHHEAIQRWCREHLSAEERPAWIVLQERLPRSPAGKILQKYLL